MSGLRDILYKTFIYDDRYLFFLEGLKYTLIIEEYLKKLQYNVNYKLWLDSFFASLLGGEK